MDRNEAPADKRKPPANGDSPILSPPRHGSTLPYSQPSRRRPGMSGLLRPTARTDAPTPGQPLPSLALPEPRCQVRKPRGHLTSSPSPHQPPVRPLSSSSNSTPLETRVRP
jgi:hypothetical protein